MSVVDQPCALFIGPTNNVQPYCRLAIITMQTMPAMSCHQRWGATAPMLLSDISTPPWAGLWYPRTVIDCAERLSRAFPGLLNNAERAMASGRLARRPCLKALTWRGFPAASPDITGD